MTNLQTPSNIGLLSVIGGDTKLKKVANTRGGEYAGKCPFCGGTDRFHVQPEQGLWTCRQCQNEHWQDDIAYVRLRNHCSFTEALDYLGKGSDYQPATGKRFIDEPEAAKSIAPLDETSKASNHPDWQAKALAFAEECNWNLYHTEKGVDVYLDYLIEQRGLNPAVIRANCLGYNPVARDERWGDVDVHLYQGIVLPWIDIKEHVWKIRFRLPVNTGQKYTQVKGSANGLYVVGAILPGDLVCMVESEFDALILKAQAWQLGGGFVPVATGGTTQARRQRWVAQVATAEFTLLSFDTDDAGEKAVGWWQGMIGEQSWRHAPLAKDPTEMWRDGFSILDWLMSAAQPEELIG
jgi:DNA primase